METIIKCFLGVNLPSEKVYEDGSTIGTTEACLANTYGGQTFTPSSDYTLTSFSLKLYKKGIVPTNFSGGIFATDINGFPIGVALKTWSLATAGITENHTGKWYEIILTSGLAVSNGVTYAIIYDQQSGNINNSIFWIYYTLIGPYLGGNSLFWNPYLEVWWPQPTCDFTFILYSTAIIEDTLRNYVDIDCSLQVHNDEPTFLIGTTIIPCSLTVIRNRVDACLGVVVPSEGHPAIRQQDIRLVISIDGEDVTDGVAGTVTIKHNFNLISTFSLTLIDPKYSLLKDLHIKANAVVIITVFINREKFVFSPFLIDTITASRSKDFKLDIKGRDYGKKLVKKRMTLISVQDSASSKTRGSIIKYLAGQAGITKVNCPQGDRIITDHSFQDQFVWDMIQKEMEIEGWHIRFDEENVMQVQPRIMKTNADWSYGEREFIELGLGGTDQGIINKVIILGAIFEKETTTVTPADTAEIPPEIDVPEEEYEEVPYTFTKSFSQGEVVEGWTDGDAVIRVTASYIGCTKRSGVFPALDIISQFPISQNYRFRISGSDSGKIKNLECTITGGATITGKSSNYFNIARTIDLGSGWPPSPITENAFSITITLKIKDLVAGGDVWVADNLPAEVAADTVVKKIAYTQIKATVQDANSIALYSELMPNKEGTLNYPLAETEAQCRRVGENVILDSHRFTKQPDEFVSCNPKLVIGNTVKLTDSKIGYNGESWIAEQIIYNFEINKETGAIKARTRVGCVFYA